MLWDSLEAPRRGASNEYPQHMFLSRNKKNIDTFWLKKSAVSRAMIIYFSSYSKKKEMLLDNEGFGAVNEQQLYHGTDSSVVDAICKKGFDWRVCGKNGTMYGQGRWRLFFHINLDKGGERNKKTKSTFWF